MDVTADAAVPQAERPRLTAQLRALATPLTLGLFLVSAVSGTALFFHAMSGTFHEMHEWLSMAFLAAFALHLWRNWNAMTSYVRRAALWIVLVLCGVAAAPFAMSGGPPHMHGGPGGPHGNPAFRMVQVMTTARLSALAPVLKTTPAALIGNLRGHGYQLPGTDPTPAQIAAASGAEPQDVLFSVMGH